MTHKPALLLLLPIASAVLVAATTPSPAERGRHVYEEWCATCHGEGIGNPGLKYKPAVDALRAKYKGELPALLTERTDLTPETIEYFVRNGVSIMPFFRKTEISDADLKALSAYLVKDQPPAQ